MAAKKAARNEELCFHFSLTVAGEEGQSVLEFLFMLPMILGLTITMVHVNSAIQVSIVDQQYARAQVLFLAFNSPIYPRLDQRVVATAAGYNQMVLGVSDDPAPPNGNYHPTATVQNVARRKIAANNDPQSEPNQRALVRIRNTVTLCTQSNVLAGGQALPILPIAAGGSTSDGYTTSGPYNLSDASRFDLCRSPLQ